MRPEGADPAEKCPVDHKTREKWLEAAKARGEKAPNPHAATATPPIVPTRFSLDTGRWVSASALSQEPLAKRPKIYRLSTDREISTIPRGITGKPDSELNPAERAALPAMPTSNNEHSATHDPASGNWIYPSQEQFFAAMRRKGHDATPSDMASIVPIHNAVNERAWKEIQEWERGWGAEKCGGPRLVSFAGDSKALTPRARWNSILGYATPFDRHDWVVERCGRNIEYVIDFYQGKSAAGAPNNGLNFYLDVRPKLNSWDGIKMRIAKTFGW